LLDEALTTTGRLGEMYGRSWALWLTPFEIRHDGLDHAEETGKAALRLQQALDNRFTMAFTLDILAYIAERRGKHTRAANTLGFGSGTVGRDRHLTGQLRPFRARAPRAHRQRASLGDHAYRNVFQQGRDLPIGSAIDYGLRATPRPKTPPAKAAAARGAEGATLTKRERQIAELVAQGCTNKDIAKRLFIAPRTAEAHVEHILVKLGFNSRTQIATWVTGTKLDTPAESNGTDR
jgi:non-specific serine/threonine protein kinase